MVGPVSVALAVALALALALACPTRGESWRVWGEEGREA
jgi:hypothetical protein